VDEAEVARPEVRARAVGGPGAEGLVRRVGATPVAGGDARAGEPDLADGVGRERAPGLGVDDPEVVAVAGVAARDEAEGASRAGGSVRDAEAGGRLGQGGRTRDVIGRRAT
jgi:hypothetical protein